MVLIATPNHDQLKSATSIMNEDTLLPSIFICRTQKIDRRVRRDNFRMQVCCYCAALKRELEFARALQLASEPAQS